MQKQIWKFELPPNAQSIAMPKDSLILSVGVQAGRMFVWAIVNPHEEKKEARKFAVLGTGHPFHHDSAMKFLGTAMLENGTLVFHVFTTN